MAETIIVPIIVALITTLAAIYATRVQDRRTAERQEMERISSINEMALELLEPYKQELTELRQKVQDLERELIEERKKRRELEELNRQKDETIAAMQHEIDELRAQIEQLQKKRRCDHERSKGNN